MMSRTGVCTQSLPLGQVSCAGFLFPDYFHLLEGMFCGIRDPLSVMTREEERGKEGIERAQDKGEELPKSLTVAKKIKKKRKGNGEDLLWKTTSSSPIHFVVFFTY